MNERTRELMLEAGFAAPELASRAQKLAELIVRDAMDYASRNWEHGHLLAEDLKVYFGVK